MSDARIEAAVAEHPSVRARASQGERMRRMASAEVLRAVPFVEFLEVGTELVDPRPGAVEFGVAVTVPVEPWSHSRAEEYRLRAAAVAEEGQTQAARLVARAFRARERLRSFEAGRADWRELAALADVSERRMLALVEARSGDPGDVLQILEEVHQSRREVLAARVAAAAARCELMRTTGRSFEDWSRGR